MNNRVVGILLFLFVASLISAQAQPPGPHSYPFGRYPARPVYKGISARPRLTTPTQRMFRTVLRNGARKGSNFAGHYTVVEWGCGSDCVEYAVVDALTGKVYDRDMPPTNDDYACGLLYKPDSTLFVVEKSATPNGDCKAYLYTWDGTRFVSVKRPAPGP